MSKHFNKKTVADNAKFIIENSISRCSVIQLFSDNELIVESVSKIEKYNENEIIVLSGKKRIEISGDGLYIKCLNDGGIAVCGKISEIKLS